ncbi:lipoprotein YedD [Enterobacteriaceae bacterium LUAb1]
MKKWIVAGTMVLSSCSQPVDYNAMIKTPAPATLQGNWQTEGPQKGLISHEAIASLMITPEGDTLDCRQWQRVIAKPGKLTRMGERWVNINQLSRVMLLEQEGSILHYDKLTLRKVERPTVECQKAMAAVKNDPDKKVIQNIQIDALSENIRRPATL